ELKLGLGTDARGGDAGFGDLESHGRGRLLNETFEVFEHHPSMNVTLLISRRVVTPARIFSTAESRRKVMPSSRAARLISEVGRRFRIISRMRSVRSSSSWMADRPRNPVPPHSKQPAPSYKGTS